MKTRLAALIVCVLAGCASSPQPVTRTTAPVTPVSSFSALRHSEDFKTEDGREIKMLGVFDVAGGKIRAWNADGSENPNLQQHLSIAKQQIPAADRFRFFAENQSRTPIAISYSENEFLTDPIQTNLQEESRNLRHALIKAANRPRAWLVFSTLDVLPDGSAGAVRTWLLGRDKPSQEPVLLRPGKFATLGETKIWVEDVRKQKTGCEVTLRADHLPIGSQVIVEIQGLEPKSGVPGTLPTYRFGPGPVGSTPYLNVKFPAGVRPASLMITRLDWLAFDRTKIAYSPISP